jgi:hypothetical protein
MTSGASSAMNDHPFIFPNERLWHQVKKVKPLLRWSTDHMQIKMVEFERQLHSTKMICIYDRIGKPDYLKKEAELSDEEIDGAWKSLCDLFHFHGISLDVCSPQVSLRELYRFATEDFFLQEIQDIRIPGMIQGFLYDDFFPDQAQDNVMLVLNHCLYQIFRKDPMEWTNSFRKKRLYLNGYEGLTVDEMVTLINGFKERVSRFELVEFTDITSHINGRHGTVRGLFRLRLRMDHAAYFLSGKWCIQLERHYHNNWKIHAVEIPGIDF